MEKRFPAIICAVLGIVALCMPAGNGQARDLPSKSRGQAVPTVSPSEGRKSNLDIGRLEKKIHDLINAERKKKGLPGLSWNEDLNRIARKYSRDMAERRFFSHDDPEGRSFIDRYMAGGFECKLRDGNTTCLGGENIAQDNLYTSIAYLNGVPSYAWKSEDKIAASVVKLWMDSRGHRENILAPYFKRQGIGIAVTGEGRVFVTENFC
jgi:uncharacterized protein YkwD